MSFVDYFLYGYGLGFFFLFWIPAGIITAILLFEAGEALWNEIRRRRARPGGDLDELAELRPRFEVSPPETALRRQFFHPLERFLMQPFSRHVNRVRHPRG